MPTLTNLKKEAIEKFRDAFGDVWNKSPQGNVMGRYAENKWVLIGNESVVSFLLSQIERAYEAGRKEGEDAGYKTGYKHGKEGYMSTTNN